MWGGGGEVQKNIRARENQMRKKSCTPISPKKYSCYCLKKIHTRNLRNEKNSSGTKIPLSPPHNFSNGPSLSNSHQCLSLSEMVTVKWNWSRLKEVHEWYVHCKRGLLTVSFVDNNKNKQQKLISRPARRQTRITEAIWCSLWGCKMRQIFWE